MKELKGQDEGSRDHSEKEFREDKSHFYIGKTDLRSRWSGSVLKREEWVD